jgi:hypothetical protein
MEHHSKHFYGTEFDGKYIVFQKGQSKANLILILFFMNFVIPPLLLLRFSFIGPFSLLNRKVRQGVLAYISAIDEIMAR